MRSIYIVLVFILVRSVSAHAQTGWMLAESIDRTNVWNRPFYAAYNSADKLMASQTDSAVYCTDCNLSAVIWKGIESNRIAVYQTDKSAALVAQKSLLLKKKLQTWIASSESNRSIADFLHAADIYVYRRFVNDKQNQLKELSIEWISIAVSINDKSFVFYVKAKDCFAFLQTYACYWVHPFNLHVKANFADALMQRNYIAKDYTIVAATNLQENDAFSFSKIPVAQKLVQTDKAAEKRISFSEDTVSVYLQALCSADIRSKENRGYGKIHLPELLLKLYSDKKIKGYAYHEGGYFTPMTAKKLKSRFVVEAESEDEYTVKRMSPQDLTQLHILKTRIKTPSSIDLRNNWLLLGMSTAISTAFENKYVIAFSFEEVLIALSTEKTYWYNGANESDSLLLSEALLTQRVAYDEMCIRNIYGDTIVTSTNSNGYHEVKSGNTLAALYYEECAALISDFDAPHKRLNRPAKVRIESFKLLYAFNPLPDHAAIVGAVVEGIKLNQLQAFKDADLKQSTSASDIIHLLDKARFYKTGNAKKDSIYISKIATADRYISSGQLTECLLTTNYKTVNGKSTNTGISFGIFIPAEAHPQYEQETLCYVSYAAMLKYLASVKTTKKYIKQLQQLPAEKAIVEVVDFYDLLQYDALDPESVVPNELPVFVRERVKR